MKTITLILSIILSPLFALCQKDTINQTDKNGRKQGYWIYYGKDRPDIGYPDTAMIEAGTYVDDRKEGLWTKYNIDGSIRVQGEYKNNRTKSLCTFSPFYKLDGSCVSEEFDSIIVVMQYANMIGPIVDTSIVIYPSQEQLVLYVDSLSKLDKSFQSSPFKYCDHSLYIEISRYENDFMCSAKYNTCPSEGNSSKIAMECAKKVFRLNE